MWQIVNFLLFSFFILIVFYYTMLKIDFYFWVYELPNLFFQSLFTSECYKKVKDKKFDWFHLKCWLVERQLPAHITFQDNIFNLEYTWTIFPLCAYKQNWPARFKVFLFILYRMIPKTYLQPIHSVFPISINFIMKYMNLTFTFLFDDLLFSSFVCI